MDSQKLTNATMELDELIKTNLKARSTYDGVICADDYCNAKLTKFKILWILKETWGKMDGRNYRDDLRDYFLDYVKFPTWERIAYTSFGILNNFCQWKDMDEIGTDPAGSRVAESIKQLSVINIKKIPGKTKTNGWEIEKAYVQNKKLILKQIDVLAPDIIISGGLFNCGLCLDMLLTDLQIPKEELTEPFKDSSVESYNDKNRIFINAYHPSYWRVPQEKYCNDIINTVKKLQPKLIS